MVLTPTASAWVLSKTVMIQARFLVLLILTPDSFPRQEVLENVVDASVQSPSSFSGIFQKIKVNLEGNLPPSPGFWFLGHVFGIGICLIY
jgi:hypothetical protein